MKTIGETSKNSGIPALFSYNSLTPIKIVDIVYSKEKTIGALLRDGRTTEVGAALLNLLSDAALAFNVGNNMNKQQSQDTVRLIIRSEEFHHFKPLDFKLCFDRAKTGRYGINYNRVDTMIVFEWLRAHDLEREEEIMDHNRNKASLPPISSDQKVSYKSILEDLGKIMTEKKEKVKKPEDYASRLHDRLMKSWLRAFDRRFKKNGMTKGVDFVMMEKKVKKKSLEVAVMDNLAKKKPPLDINAFLKHRLDRYIKMVSVAELMLFGKIVKRKEVFFPIVKTWYRDWHIVPNAFEQGYEEERGAQVELNKYIRLSQPTAYKILNKENPTDNSQKK